MREVSGGGGSALAGRRSMLSLDRLIPRLEATVKGTRDPRHCGRPRLCRDPSKDALAGVLWAAISGAR